MSAQSDPGFIDPDWVIQSALQDLVLDEVVGESGIARAAVEQASPLVNPNPPPEPPSVLPTVLLGAAVVGGTAAAALAAWRLLS